MSLAGSPSAFADGDTAKLPTSEATIARIRIGIVSAIVGAYARFLLRGERDAGAEIGTGLALGYDRGRCARRHTREFSPL
jgi:hypothetical protein